MQRSNEDDGDAQNNDPYHPRHVRCIIRFHTASVRENVPCLSLIVVPDKNYPDKRARHRYLNIRRCSMVRMTLMARPCRRPCRHFFSTKTTTHFGFQQVDEEAKKPMVASVFHSVADRYDHPL
jgi:hypothetical protein